MKMIKTRHKQAMKSLPDNNEKRFVAVLNKQIETGVLFNALGHMSAGLGASPSLPPANPLFVDYIDGSQGKHPNISHYPFIVLKARNSNKISQLREKVLALGLPFTDFTESMLIGTSEEQLALTKTTNEADLQYVGLCMFGDTEVLKTLTSKFSLFK
jgi:hypothetical protein